MPRLRKKSINPIVPPIERVETASRNYLVNNRETLRSTERVLRQDPRTQRELDLGGGLNNLLTRSSDESLEIIYLSRFVNVQTSLFVDRVTNGDILRTPSLETMFEQNNTKNKILTAVASELESCCEEIKAKLEDLTNLVTTQFRRLRNLLISNFTDLETEGRENFEQLKSTILESKESVLNQLNTRLNIIETLVDQSNTFIQNRIQESRSRIETAMQSFTNAIL